MQTDSDLVRRAQQGEAAATGQLYDRHYQRIFRFVWSRVHDQPLAEDITAEVFAHMVHALPTYRDMSLPFQAWLYRIARNLVVDYHRRNQILTAVPLEEVSQMAYITDTPSNLVEQKLAAEGVQHALSRLDPAQQEVLNLRFIVGLPVAEVAQTLDKSVAAVKSLQHRGLLAMRGLLLADNA
jgi:RNA polymerase sigma-70 factor (ECF subfamily)